MSYRVSLTVEGVEHTADLPAFGGAKLLSPAGEWKGDAFWVGRELVIANGAASDDPEHNNPIRRLEGQLVITENGEMVYSDEVDIDDGAGHYVPLRPVSKIRLDPRDSVFVDWHNAHGPDEPDFEGWWLQRVMAWGPNPDAKDPGNTGSSRMVRGRAPMVHKLLHEIAEGDLTPDEALMADSQRWVGAQWERQVHYYDWGRPGLLPDMPAWWDCEHANRDGRKHRVGWGYRAPGGIDTGTYSGQEYFGRITDGVVWRDSSIPYPPDHAHFEVQKVLWIALFTKSFFSVWHAVACIEANHSRKQPNTGAWWSMARSYGWTFEGEAMWAKALEPYMPSVAERIWRYAEWTLEKLEGQNVLCIESGVMLNSMDGGGQSAAINGALELMPGKKLTYHRVRGVDNIKGHGDWKKDNPDVPEIESPFVEEWPIEQGSNEQLRGVKVFFLGILASGLDKMIEFAPHPLAVRARVQMDIAAHALTRALGPSLDVSTLAPQGNFKRNFLYLVGLTAPNTSSPAGVDTSFVLPGVECAIRRYPEQTQVLVAWVDQLMAAMKASNYWGGSGQPDQGKQSVSHGPGWETARRGAIPE